MEVIGNVVAELVPRNDDVSTHILYMQVKRLPAHRKEVHMRRAVGGQLFASRIGVRASLCEPHG